MRTEVSEGSHGTRFFTGQGYATSAGLYRYYFATINDILPGRSLPEGVAEPEEIERLEGVREPGGRGRKTSAREVASSRRSHQVSTSSKEAPEIRVITSVGKGPKQRVSWRCSTRVFPSRHPSWRPSLAAVSLAGTLGDAVFYLGQHNRGQDEIADQALTQTIHHRGTCLLRAMTMLVSSR